MIPAAAKVPSMGAKMPEMRSMITSVALLGAASSSSASTAPPSLKPPALRTAS